MIRRHLILFSAALLPVLTTAAGFDAVTATNQLGLDLYRRLAAASPDGNLVLSPYSISSALALAYAGADGATRSEMAGVLHFPTDDAPVQASLGALRATLDVVGQSLRHDNGRPLLEWHQANRLFGQQGYDFCPSFLALMKDGYGAPFEPLDVRAKTETARDFINAWVARQTHEKIPEVVPPGGLNPRTRLVLVSALYLKAPWAEPFEKRGTRLRPFHVPGARALKMPTLQRTDFLRYAREGGFTVVALDYLGGDLQFLILLPDEGTDCHALAARLGPGDFKKWAALEEKTRSAEVELYLPKFRIDGPTQPLGAALRALGMRRA